MSKLKAERACQPVRAAWAQRTRARPVVHLVCLPLCSVPRHDPLRVVRELAVIENDVEAGCVSVDGCHLFGHLFCSSPRHPASVPRLCVAPACLLSRIGPSLLLSECFCEKRSRAEPAGSNSRAALFATCFSCSRLSHSTFTVYADCDLTRAGFQVYSAPSSRLRSIVGSRIVQSIRHRVQEISYSDSSSPSQDIRTHTAPKRTNHPNARGANEHEARSSTKHNRTRSTTKMPAQIKTPLTELLNIKHPIMLAGMSNAAGPELAAAVTNAGGIGQ